MSRRAMFWRMVISSILRRRSRVLIAILAVAIGATTLSGLVTIAVDVPAQMAREIFPNAPLKYMPPTKFMTGNIFRGHIQDALFNMVTILTNQKLCLLGMMTEAIHTPFMSDRALSIENAQYIFRTMKDLGDELTYKEGGIIRTRANEVLTKATDLLAEIEKLGLFTTIEKGIFADVKRPKDGGKGLNGVVVKDDKYFNPFVEVMKGKVGA